MIRKIAALCCVLLIPALSQAQVSEAGKPTKTITNASITGTTVFSSDTVYILDKAVFVESGEKLIIEPGTIIKGKPGDSLDASYLCVARGGKIFAEGTKEKPIIFTAEADNVDNPSDIALGAAGKGLWGSLIILGNAPITAAGGNTQIEGIDQLDPRGNYGGPDANDNSGVVRYVSLRHGGTIIGANNEINGLTLGGVGRGTTIEYIEAYQNLDDGIEFFGGTVNARYLAAMFCDDDGIDWDFGYSGSIQFAMLIKDPSLPSSASRGFEMDYCTPGGCSPSPGVWPNVSNVTMIGSGAASGETDNDYVFAFRTASGGHIFNSIFENFARQVTQVTAVGLGLVGTPQLEIANNLFYNFGSGATWTLLSSGAGVDAYMSANNTLALSTSLTATNWTYSGILDPKPVGAGTSGFTSVTDPNSFINNAVTYRGAFDPAARNWMCDWTASSFYGLLAPCATLADCGCITEVGKPVKNLNNTNFGALTRLASDTVYVLDTACFVESGEQLIIAPGTIIKGAPGDSLDASYLLVARGAQIFALGTEECPVVMTALSDNVDNPTDIPLGGAGRGLWGSLIVLGNAPITAAGGNTQIEGVDQLDPRGNYGGAIANDNSGVIQYVSLRHGGTIIGANNEINGLTLGGVGNGTTVHHIEAYQNLDDGVEFFGGTVNASHLVIAFCDDDGIDWDFGYKGSIQYAFLIKDAVLPSSASRGFEMDYCTPGGCSPSPGVWPYVTNTTMIGSGAASGETDNDYVFAFRTASGGHIFNSVFEDWARQAVQVTAVGLGLVNTPQLELKQNVFGAFGSGATFTALCSGAGVDAYMAANNQKADPLMNGISRIQNGLLDPRLASCSIADTGAISIVDPNGFIVNTTYRGAFAPGTSIDNLWLSGWSFLSCGGYLGDVTEHGCSCCVGDRGDVFPLATGDGGVDISDLQVYIDYLFFGGSAPSCLQEFDTAGNDNAVDISDLQVVIDYLFFGAAIPGC